MIALYNYLYVTLSTGSKDLLHPVLAGGIRTARNRVLLVVTVGVRFLSLLLEGGVLTDGSVGLGVQGLQVVRSKVSLEVLAEVSTEFLLILFLHEPHVVGNMTTNNVGTEGLSVQGTLSISNKALGGVGNIQTTVSSSLQRSENLSTGGGAGKTDVKEGLEGATGVVITLNMVLLTKSLFRSRVQLVKAEVLQMTAGQQQTSAVGSRVVGQTDSDTVAGELVGVGTSNDTITRELRIDQLVDDILVGDTNNHTVLGGGILVLILGHEPLTSIVVSFALSPSAVLDLVPLEVRLVLDDFDETHCRAE